MIFVFVRQNKFGKIYFQTNCGDGLGWGQRGWQKYRNKFIRPVYWWTIIQVPHAHTWGQGSPIM